mgnify:CR=1 FL=1
MASNLLAISSYPSGFGSGVAIRELPLATVFAGNIYWVNSVTGSNQNKGTRDRPFATLDYAIGRCTASNGDVVMIAPGHAESITSATALAFDVAGVTIVGLGYGSNRPTFTFTTANTATIAVSAANVAIMNCIFVGNFLSIATCFTLTTAPEFTVDRCEFRDTSAVLGFLSIITTTVSVNSDGLTFTNNVVQSDATTSPGPAIVIANTLDRLTVVGNLVTHTVASNNVSALIEHGALVVTHAYIAWNHIYSINTDTATGAILVKTTATTGSGMIEHNRVRAQDVAGAILVTANAVQYGMFDNLYTGETTLLSGFVLPAIATDA